MNEGRWYCSFCKCDVVLPHPGRFGMKHATCPKCGNNSAVWLKPVTSPRPVTAPPQKPIVL